MVESVVLDKKVDFVSTFEKQQALVDSEIKLKWEKEQNELKEKLILDDQLTFDVNKMGDADDLNTLKLVGAIDISYSKKDE